MSLNIEMCLCACMALCMCRLSRLSVMMLNGVSVRQCFYGEAKACEGVRV